ncbi:MAG: hypothetical protein A3D65_04160 [Candidatus Lloydbacteria bacterium RIFCSPHIGHO2_02_FULL_50_13]|uniref:DUF5671 domain-containing protein n=1 Tax=Candidatus Lloydbacteria bacterium RIFCSPHIGHO2_02_FULL_50_13 TaxID=1798661 RepID=A0A1G2DA47_9BACT|nr:MAG: hypothetical protein A3D65_04160 [Candidatus Lloydbacteria bacterium RIFCSPHIGHO2_02_FULL_50_13]
MDQSSLNNYAAERLRVGMTPEALKQNLLAVGWSDEEAGAAIVAGLVASGVPTPKAGVRASGGKLSSTVEVVLNFFSFIALCIVSTSLGVLYYQVINHYFPDPLIIRYGGVDVSAEAIHYAIAALIITFPIYAFALRLWFKRFRDDEEKVETRLTKWLTYLVLLVTAVAIVGDLIVAVFYFLQGEITARFFLKALTILVIAGTIFDFYFLERKKIQYKKDIPRRIFQGIGWFVLGSVVVAIVLGFTVGGSPNTARKQGLDTQRANDLREIAGCVANFGGNQKRLPDTLDELSSSGQYAYCSARLADPETGVPYEYRVVSHGAVISGVREGAFELCANFTLEADGDVVGKSAYGYPGDKWVTHGAERSCDTEKANLERYLDQPPETSAAETVPQAIPAIPPRKI